MQQLEKLLIEGVEKNTPEFVKNDKVFDYTNKNKFTFTLTRDLVEKLDLKKWFEGYKKEAMVSTAGIRGPQNILYPHDTRFPINTIGITLATLAKALVVKEKYPKNELIKLAGSEVRYNSRAYLDIIARIQAALGIKTLVPTKRQTIPIWLASFLAFKLDLVGAEYITSSHGISVKNATKDLNNQGSQFLPNESLEFVNKIEEILDTVNKNGEYKIEFAASSDSLIDEKTMERLNNGVDLYVEYLKSNVASDVILNKIRNFDKKIVIDAVGGAAYNTLSKILEKLNVSSVFDWLNIEEDPFFHSIGKDVKNGVFYDWSLDITVVSKDKEGKPYFPVINSLKYNEKLAKYPIGTVCLVTDPDHDRLSVVQIEDIKNKDEVIKAGVDAVELDDGRILCIFSANQAFLMIMDFWAKQLKESGEFSKHTRFIVKTTASSKSWDEWAKANDIKVVNTPVGFKEIANVIKKVEFQLEDGIKDIEVEDIFKSRVKLGESPRMIFGGEESGGMIIGSNDIIKSLGGRMALAMREKSATEAIIAASGLVASLNIPLWKHLENVYNENKIKARFDVRDDIAYYNESEPDIEKLKAAKLSGEALRTKNDLFYLALAVGIEEGKLTLQNAKEILTDVFKDNKKLDFSNLLTVKFVGDGTYLDFDDKFIEIRPSGTDAKTKAYAGGSDKELLAEWSKVLGNYSGDLTVLYKKYLSEEYVQSAKEKSLKLYDIYANNGIDSREFKIPAYRF